MRYVLTILLLLIIVAPTRASTDIDTLGDFMQEVRWELDYRSNDVLPDSALIGLAKRAIIWTSTDIGGVEATYRVITDTLQQFYALPDSIVEILFATLLRGKITYSIKAFTPAYFEDYFEITDLQQDDELAVPQAYNYWADTIQFLPIPIRVDSIYLKCYIEHPYVDSKDDSIQLRPAYIEAAIAYCCHLSYRRWKRWDEAALYLVAYEALRLKLINKYKRPMELPLPRQ